MRTLGRSDSTMLALTAATGRRIVLRLMTNEPWKHTGSPSPSERSSPCRRWKTRLCRLPQAWGWAHSVGTQASLPSNVAAARRPLNGGRDASLTAIATLLTVIDEVKPAKPFRAYEWAWDEKRILPPLGDASEAVPVDDEGERSPPGRGDCRLNWPSGSRWEAAISALRVAGARGHGFSRHSRGPYGTSPPEQAV